MTENAHVAADAAPHPSLATPNATPEAQNVWEALQLRIARRADELARHASPLLRLGSGRLLWVKAEREILGPGSRVALADLLHLCARFSRQPT